MKKQTLLVLGVVLLAGMAPLYAQSSATVRFQIPFEFVVSDLTLPAGDYDVEYVAQSNLLSISSVSGKPTVMVITNPVSGNSSPAKSELIFNRYGAKYFLSQMWMSNSDRGRVIKKTAYESEVAALGLKTATVEVAAK